MRRRNLLAGGAALATVGTTGLARPAIAQGAAAKVLRFVPQADLANPDPIWTTATVATNHGYMVWDTLYGVNDALIGQPQMCAGHEVSSDELTWTFTLRDGLKFTDGEPVRGVDCTTSIARWAVKNPFGQQLSAQTDEMKPLDDKRFQIRLKKRFRQMTYALGSQGCFVMPERMAKTPASEQIKEFIGSGPFIFKRDEWVVRLEGGLCEEPELRAAAGKARVLLGRQGGEFRAGRMVSCSRTRPPRPRPCRPARSIGWNSRCSTCCRCCASRRGAMSCATIRSARWRSSRSITCFRRSTIPNCCARCCRRSTSRTMSPPGSASSRIWASIRWASSLATRRWRTTPAWTRSPRKRDLAKAKKLVAESGYNGEKIVMMAPSDQPSLVAPSQVIARTVHQAGLNVDYQVMDWGTLVARRARWTRRRKGGWNVFHTTWGGLATSNPGSSFPLRGNGKQGWFGWPTDAQDGGTARSVVRCRRRSRSRRRSASRSSCRRFRVCRSCRSGSGIIRGRSART